MSKDWSNVKDIWRQTHPEVDSIVLEHLFNKGVNLKDVSQILKPDYESGLHDFNLLPDIDKASERILEAIKQKESVLIFTDYDADGLPGAAIIDTFFKKIGYQNYQLQTPDRNVDGFGLKTNHVEAALESGIDLIVTIDCGSASGPAIAVANEHDLDVIVTDHHEVPELADNEKPFAMVNPMVAGSKYPYSHICGAVVVFKLIQAIIATGYKTGIFTKEAGSEGVPALRSPGEGWEKWLLDLAAIATVGDMMPLVDENRVIVSYGLQVLNQTRNYGLRALIDSARLERGSISATDISFRIAPRLNAASRLGKGHLALQVLTADNPLDATRLAAELEGLNNERRKVVTQMVKVAHKKLGPAEEFSDTVVSVGDPAWLPGMCGLLASRLVEEYGVSAFVWGRGPSTAIKGSCRAVAGDNVHAIMSAVESGIFASFGGHVGAGGFVLEADAAHQLQAALVAARESVSDSVVEEENASSTSNSMDLAISDISADLLSGLSALEPCGRAFPQPQFKIKLEESVTVSQFGKGSEHLKLQLTSGLSAIKWRTKTIDYDLEVGQQKITAIVGSLEPDSYSRIGVRVLIEEIITD